MAEVALLAPTNPSMDQVQQDSMGSDMYPASSRKVAAPEPNPNFSFPMLQPEEKQSSPTLEPNYGQPRTGRRGSRPQNISISPSVPLVFPPLPSPGKTPPTFARQDPSPTRSINSHPRSGGHRRGGSEFIGGDGSMAGPGLMSTSPTKGADALPSPPTSGRRRGHAHRRSGAISNHDISFMLKPSAAGDRRTTRSGSAPNSPSDPSGHKEFIPTLEHSQSQPTLHIPPVDEDVPPLPTNSSPATAQSRPRVGFSDTLEFIPRPLSTISSETSSSLSTIRASHSVTGSITSVISTGTSSPPSAKKNRHTSDTLQDYRLGEQRPRTAESPSSYSPSNTPFGRRSPSSRPSSAGAGKALMRETYNTRLSPQTNSSPDKENVSPMTQFSSATFAPLNESATFPQSKQQQQQALPDLQVITKPNSGVNISRPRSSPEAKVGRSQGKVKSWAGSLLSRKTKSKGSEGAVDASTPQVPLREFAPMDDFSLDDVNFDEDTTCVIRSPGFQSPATSSSYTSPTYSGMASQQEPDAPGSVLDLDASWNDTTAAPQNPAASGYASAKHRMHSSGSTGGFIGPGMHYHRRAESAPALTPINTSSSLHRLGSNPQMADVFEEEEEEEIQEKPQEEQVVSGSQDFDDGNEMRGLGVQVVDLETGADSAPARRPSRTSKPSSVGSDGHEDEGAIVEAENEADEDMTQASPEDMDIPVEIVEAADEPRFSVITKSSDGSTITPTLSAPRSSNNMSGAVPHSLDFAQISPQPSGDFTASSSSTSPDVSHLSFDGARLNTAASSITDRSTWGSTRSSSKAQEITAPSCSSEDVPSLTSSASTMISGHPPQVSPVFESRPGAERAYSFSSLPHRRSSRPASAAGKRSSLASLSRLVGASYGEKSKLSVEAFNQEGEDAAGKPEKKRNRISRLMKFWKSKEKLNATVD